MLPLLLIFLSFVAAVEIARRLPLLRAFREVAATSIRVRRVLGYRRCLERRKERSLQRLSLRMLRQSLRAGELLALVVAPIALLIVADALLELQVLAALMDWRMRAALIVLSLGYAFIRHRFRQRLRPC